MRRIALILILVSLAITAHAAEVIEVRPWELHSSFWMSLHQTLIADAMRQTPRPLSALSEEERAAWTEAVAAYRTAGGRGDMTFSRPMIVTTDTLTQAVEAHWLPYLNGRGSLEDAIDGVVGAIPR